MTPNQFVVPNNLSLIELERDHKAGQLVLRPAFQRRPVWTDEQKSFLIDSILRGYPVPEIYFYVSDGVDSDPLTKYVVDGQQRLRACLEFMSDRLPISFDVDKLAPIHGAIDTPWLNKTYSELGEDDKRQFDRYKLVVRTLEGLSEDAVRHIFFRLNQANVVLNSQELRFSNYAGGFLELVENIVRWDEWEHYRIFTTNQRRRMLDAEFISELVLGYLNWPQNKKDELDEYYLRYASEVPFQKELIEAFRYTSSLLVRLFPEPRFARTRWGKKSDFYTLFLAIARRKIRIKADTDVEVHYLRSRLIEFSNLIDGGEVGDPDSPLEVYRRSVSRAASDRARRVRREKAILAYLDDRSRVDDDLEGDELGWEIVEYEDDSEEDEAYSDEEIPLISPTAP